MSSRILPWRFFNREQPAYFILIHVIFYWWQCVCTKYILKGSNFILRVSLPTHKTQTPQNGQRDRLTGRWMTRQADRQTETGIEILTDKSRLDCRIDWYYMSTIFRTIIFAFTHTYNVDCKFKQQHHNIYEKIIPIH